MALVLADRVKETTVTTGLGTLTLAGASEGFQSFAAIGNGNSTFYTIASQTPGEWEVGIGTYTASGTTLSRDTVLASSSGGSKVNLSAGTKDVFVTYPAERAVAVDSGAPSGYVITSDGTNWTSAPPPSGITYFNESANYTAANKDGVLTDTTAGSFTVTLPATPLEGWQVVIADAAGTWGTNNLTVGRNGSTIAGVAQDLLCNINGASVTFVYDGTTWVIFAQVGGNGGTGGGGGPTFLAVTTRAGGVVEVSVFSGSLPVLTRGGTTVNVPVN